MGHIVRRHEYGANSPLDDADDNLAACYLNYPRAFGGLGWIIRLKFNMADWSEAYSAGEEVGNEVSNCTLPLAGGVKAGYFGRKYRLTEKEEINPQAFPGGIINLLNPTSY